jgi:hypothetical protein
VHKSEEVSPSISQAQEQQSQQPVQTPRITAFQTPEAAPSSSLSSFTNGERPEQTEYTPTIEAGRRTARGELFRRPPQVPPQATSSPSPVQQGQQHPQPAQQQQNVPAQTQGNHHRTHVPPTPTHEINLPLGNMLHLAYNPGYTGAEEARSALLHKLTAESKAGGRARCWSCGALAVAYDRWSFRSKTFGEIGVAMCEVCGVWSVM